MKRRPRLISPASLVLDAQSQRRFDENGFLHVTLTNISKECVNEYLGGEILSWQELGLKADKIYRAYRSGAELAKAAATFRGIPLLRGHYLDSADDPQTEHRVGSLLGDCRFSAPYLQASLCVWDAEAIRAIENDEEREISCAYIFDADFTPGTFDGQHYDFVMRNIRANHVALVEKGRAGNDVGVADAQNKRGMFMNLRKAAVRLARRVLAKDEDLSQQDLAAVAQVLAAEGQGDKSDSTDTPTGDTDPDEPGKGVGLDEDIEAKVQRVVSLLPELDAEKLTALVDVLRTVLASDEDGDPEKAPLAGDEDDPDPAGAGDEDDGPSDKGGPSGKDGKDGKDPLAGDEDDTPGGCTPGAGKVAQDALLRRLLRTSMASDAAKAAVSHVNALHAAAAKVRPITGEIKNPCAFDSANAIYGRALKLSGLDPRLYPASALEGICDVLVNMRTAASTPPPLAADAKDGPAKNLNRIRVEA